MLQAKVGLNASAQTPGASTSGRLDTSGGKMASTAAPADGLEPIDMVARRLGLRASAIRYYEDRGLVAPASRRAGRRWYGPTEIRRLAIIGYWQAHGLMSLEEIKDILDGPADGRRWSQVVTDRIASLRAQIERMEATREYLEHVLTHHPDSAPDGCDHFESLLFEVLPRTTE
jgi:MerR family transcriptional regulator, copper efflux regulator